MPRISVKGNLLLAKRAIGKRIKARREEAGLTQAELGAKVGVSQEAVSRWEAGLTALALAELGTVARVLQSSLGWLAAAEGEPPGPYRVEEILPEKHALGRKETKRHFKPVPTKRRKGNE
jgi:transcriptional regulator with XRE-family HTH domain